MLVVVVVMAPYGSELSILQPFTVADGNILIDTPGIDAPVRMLN